MKIESTVFFVEPVSRDLELSHRYHNLCEAKNHLLESLVSVMPDFPLAIYGSSVYGYCKDGAHGKLDDLDFLSVVSREFDFQKILNTLRKGGLEHVQTEHDADILFTEGMIDIVRVSSTFEGHCCSMHVFAEDIVDLGYRATQVGMAVRNLVPNTPKYTNKVNSSTTFLGEKINCPVESTVINDSAITTGYFSHTVKGIPTVDVRADKLLTCEVVWDPSHRITKAQKKFWKNFVRAALFYQPDISNEDILKMFGRYDRFSYEYKQRLLLKIEKERDNLFNLTQPTFQK